MSDDYKQPLTHVIVGQKIWASVIIAPGDVHPAQSKNKMSTASKAIFDGKAPVKKQLIVLAITESKTHFICVYTSTFGSSSKLDPKKVVDSRNWLPIHPAVGVYEALAQPQGGDGLAGWICLSQTILVSIADESVQPLQVFYPEDSVAKIKGKVGL
ncbi:hypothetical protein M413DRAFT_420239 [Hebeloma cylindrosporum]|uniref:Uncharacterized protein n=1 Tax=Hebeloma cylindrosporum TaxID=76867 RepID=A0A0C2XL48_HEBCY|nr:hypothetical protein M413DRAFT_420239 [Hebeloma cylindrosporum h7]